MNIEYVRIWKDAVMFFFKISFHILLGKTQNYISNLHCNIVRLKPMDVERDSTMKILSLTLRTRRDQGCQVV